MVVIVNESSQIGEARRFATAMAERLDFNAEDLGRVALVASEMGTNLVKHASDGRLLITTFSDGDGIGVELLALDTGPGMSDVGRCWTDGFSTAGGQGIGLGAISRMSDSHDLYSRSGTGTVIMARLHRRGRTVEARPSASMGAVTVPLAGESACGDAWRWSPGHAPTLFLVDGLGHGPLASAAADVATRIYDASAGRDCVSRVGDIHRALVATRGAAIALAEIDFEAHLVRYVGVGNVCGAFVNDGKLRRMVSHNGTAGHGNPRIAEFTYPFTGTPLLIMHSDGLSTRWDINAYAGLASRHPSVIAGVLYRDHARGTDDACVAVLRPSHG